ncbi:condensation domain-containing protein [Streptomyces tubercidicus]|uniref:hypothetical protein n=1 Tax=Streptomyces tubercidicus TaxID=47759 RepID=UPI00368B5977
MLELHGRQETADGMDPTRTVGWFTALTPLLIDAPPQTAPHEVLHNARAARSNAGPDHNPPHHATTNTTTPTRLTKTHRPWVSVNYLGNLGSVFAGTAQQDTDSLTEIPLPHHGDRGPDNPRPIHWEFSAHTKTGKLTMRLAHAGNEDTANHLLDTACHYLHTLTTTPHTAPPKEKQ